MLEKIKSFIKEFKDEIMDTEILNKENLRKIS